MTDGRRTHHEKWRMKCQLAGDDVEHFLDLMTWNIRSQLVFSVFLSSTANCSARTTNDPTKLQD